MHIPQTSVALGILSALVEDYIPYPRTKSVRGNWPLRSRVVPRGPPGGIPWLPVASRGLTLTTGRTIYTFEVSKTTLRQKF